MTIYKRMRIANKKLMRFINTLADLICSAEQHTHTRHRHKTMIRFGDKMKYAPYNIHTHPEREYVNLSPDDLPSRGI